MAETRLAPSIIPLAEVSKRFGISMRSLRDSGWRARAGLRVTKLGGRVLGVRRRDLYEALRREEHKVPRNGRDGA